MSTYTKYERGSVWRKWDLHFHAPTKYTCAKNDLYEGTDLTDKQNRFISELKEIKDISVIGITDYFSLDGYKLVQSHQSDLLQFDLILPNIELRITPVTGENRKINLHIIPNTSELSVEDIERFLYKFEFGPERFTCKEADLIRLGKKFNRDYSNEEAFRKGLNEFSISYDRFFEEYNSLPIRVKENILIGVSNNSNDGASGIKDIQGIRDIIYSGVHFIFSAQSSDRNYFLGKSADSLELIKEKYGNLLPCLHGSDFHGSNTGKILCVPDENRFCWIKSDPTFEGLRQVLFEPEDRVKIQSTIPEDKAGYQIIERIEISNELIYNQSLLLNANLNSIIGGRSSGKSILLGAVAKKLKTSRTIKLQDENYDTFVGEISNSINVFWKDGEEDNNREVEYFQQGYMHEIARSNEKLNLLIQEILNQKGKDTIIASYEKYISENSKKISSFISDYFQTLKFKSEKEQKARDTGDKKGIEEEIRKLKEESAKLAVATISDDDKSAYEIIKEEINKQIQQRKTIENDSKQIQILKQVSIFREDLSYDLISLSDARKEEIEDFYNSLKSETENKWRAKLEEIEKNISLTTESISQKIIELESNSTYKKVLEAYQKNDQLSEFENKIKIQNAKLFEINTVLGEIQNLKKQEEEIFDKITSALKAYFLKTQEIIPELTAAKDGLVINVREKFEINKYQSILYSGLNQQGVINQSISSFEYRDNNSFEEHILNVFKKLSENVLTLKGGYSNQSLATNLLSTNFYSLDYDVQYEGDDFRKMSDGKKAFVVLKLLLDFSDKNCPILIDQPEDDLDNRAIYNDLVLYLRNKKQLRQIIVATHNPNIVVGADSELVIVANQNGERNLNNSGKKFQYVAGSLEHTFPKNGTSEILVSQGTREHVCEVLEGGNIAFKLREKKYSIKE